MVSFKCRPSRWNILSVFGFQRAIPAAVMVRETPWDQTPHVMITHGHTWARIFVCSSYKYFLGACMDARTQPLATGGICGCGNHDEYSSVGISDVSGRVPTPVMGREMLEALLLNKTSHVSSCRSSELMYPSLCWYFYWDWSTNLTKIIFMGNLLVQQMRRFSSTRHHTCSTVALLLTMAMLSLEALLTCMYESESQSLESGDEIRLW